MVIGWVSAFNALAAVFGRSIGTPTVIRGAATMKMINSTSITSTKGVTIDLPKTAAKALNADTQPITISVRADGEIYLQETPIPAEEVAAKLQAVATTGYTERIFVRGDGTAPYGIIADVMSRIQNAGFTNIGLVTEQKQDE